MIVRLDPAAREDIVEAVEWYAQRDSKVARRFVAAVDAAMSEITEFPDGPPRLETWLGSENIRRVLLHRFPYVVVYEIFSDDIVVWSISHTNRKPNHWQTRRRLEGPG